MFKHPIKISLFILLLLAVDLGTKFLLEGDSFPVLQGIFSVQSTHNTGAAWSILEGQTWLFIVGAILFIIGFLLFDYFVKPKSKLYEISFILFMVGTIGNMIDRIVYGYVRDFIQVDFMSFPIFNVADSCLTIGAILFSIFILFIYEPKDEKKKEK